MIDYLQNKTESDYFVINFAVIVDRITNIKNKDARHLNARKMDRAYLGAIEGCKEMLIEENLSDIFHTCKNMLFNDSLKDSDNTGVLFAIISEINPILNEKEMDLIEYVPETINEAYIGFLYCLMVDSESANKVFSVINEIGVTNTIFEMLASAHSYTHAIDESNDPDISFLMFGLKIINRAVQYMPDLLQFFIANCDVFINALWTNLNDKMLGFLFEFTTLLLENDDVRSKVYDYLVYMDIFKHGQLKNSNNKTESVYTIFERESKHKKYHFTEGFVRFCSVLVSYKILEPEIYAFFNVAIESSNPKIVILILQKIGENELLLNNKILTSIKKGIESDDKICSTFVDFIIDLNAEVQKKVISFVTKDVSFLSLIFSISSKRFFELLYLIDLNEVAMFLSDDFLDRMSENQSEGLKFLIYATKNNEICRFILRKADYMNLIVDYDDLKLKLYNVICDNCLSEFDAVVGKSKERNVFEIPELQTADFYDILVKLVLYSYESKGKTRKFVLKEYTYNEANIQSYCRYLKCLVVIEQSIEKEVNYLIALDNANEYIADLVSYSNIINDTTYQHNAEACALQTTLLSNIGSKNNSFFVSKYDTASKFDKYLLFFVLDTSNITKDVYDIVLKQLYSISDNLFSEENSLFLRHCLSALMTYARLDDVIKLFNGVDVPEEFANRIVMLNIVSLLNENTEILNMNIIKKASYDLQAKICFIGWIKQMMKYEDVKSWAIMLRKHVVDEELEFMVKEMNKIKY